MLDVRQLREGDLVRLNRKYKDDLIKGSVYAFVSRSTMRGVIRLRKIKSVRADALIEVSTSIVVDIFDRIDNEVDYIIQENYHLGSDSYGYYFFDKRKQSDSTKPVTELTFTQLSKIYKYIPVMYKGFMGFYYKGNLIIRSSVTTKAIYNRNGGRVTPSKVINKILFIKINENEVVNFYSEEPIKQLCKIKIKDYVISSKLFKYTGEKKELLNQTLEASSKKETLSFNILEIKLNSELKNTTERQNTISIDGKTRKLRFVMEEIEIIYPNVNGWIPTKDRIIKEGSTVKLKDNRKFREIPKNEVIVINNIRTVGNKKYIGFTFKGKQIYDRSKNFKAI